MADKEYKEFELTPDELEAVKAKVAEEKPEGGVKEAAQRAAVAKALEFLKDKKKEDANTYIKENCMITEITKPFMAAYIKTYATKEDTDWIKDDFKKASTKIMPRKVSTICMGANGIPIHKKNAKGEFVPKKVRVDAITGETYETFNLAGARAEFVKHFGITPKANKFTPKPQRKSKKYDPFADLF